MKTTIIACEKAQYGNLHHRRLYKEFKLPLSSIPPPGVKLVLENGVIGQVNYAMCDDGTALCPPIYNPRDDTLTLEVVVHPKNLPVLAAKDGWKEVGEE